MEVSAEALEAAITEIQKLPLGTDYEFRHLYGVRAAEIAHAAHMAKAAAQVADRVLAVIDEKRAKRREWERASPKPAPIPEPPFIAARTQEGTTVMIPNKNYKGAEAA